MRDEPFPPPRLDRNGRRPPTFAWALMVLVLWELDGLPELDGPALDQVVIALSIVGVAGGYIPA